MSDDDVSPLNIEKGGYEKRKSNNSSRSEELNEKSQGVFKIKSDDGFDPDFFKRFERTPNSKIRTGHRIGGPNSDTVANVGRIDSTDEELIDFVKGNVSSVGISQGEGVLMQRISFNPSAFREKEMQSWLEDRGLPTELNESPYFSNHKDQVLLSEETFYPSEWRLYSFKEELKILAGYFENYK